MTDTTDATDHMKLWNSVCVTDPDHTKQVNQRGGFTAIDAMYQIRNATEQFGPVGKGWGWTADLTFQDGACVAQVVLWWRDSGGKQRYCGPIFGCKTFVAKGGRLDEDAPKKAVTDGLTKSLSYLGFNADVFLGKFDDHKYVDALRAAKAGQPPAPQATLPPTLTASSLIAWVDAWRGEHGSSLNGTDYTGVILKAEFPGRVPKTPLSEGQLLTVKAVLEAGRYDKVTGDALPTE